MKKPLFLLILLLASAQAFAAERLSNGFTQPADAFFRAGFWWDPNDPGWGLDLHMSGGSLVGIWATYDEQGHATWYLGIGALEGQTWVMPLSRYRWDGQTAVPDGQAGELRIGFTDGYHAEMSWTLGSDQGAAAIETFLVDDTPVYADRTGFWYEPAQTGYGLSVSTQGPLTMSVFYFYDGDGQPRWAWADNGANPGGPMGLLSFRRCAECGGGLDSVTVGEMALSFHSEAAASLDATLTLSDPLAGSWDTRGRVITLLTSPPSGRLTLAQLAPFTNPELLNTYMRGAQPAYPYYPGVIDFSPQPPGTEGGSISGTNVQEQGVDESDLIKSDGQFVFALSPGALDGRPRLRVFEMDPASPSLVPRVELEVGGGQEVLQGMYLITGRPEGQRDLLVIFAGVASYYDPFSWFSPVPWFEGNTKLFVFDVSDRGQPLLTHEIEIEGAGAETRRIGEKLYVVTRFIPSFLPEEEAALPGIKINGVERELTDPSRYYMVAGDPNYPYRDITTLSAFDLGALDADPDSIALVGFPEALYVSLNNAYVATSRSAYRIDPQFGELYYPYEVFTDVHQFSLTEDGVEYAGTGIVPGFLSHSGVGPSFAFSEHKNHLRVVTTSSYMFGDQDHRLTVLRLAGEEAKVLPVVGFVPNDQRPQPLGKPGEFLYGLRFLGDRLYAVTFKSIDPLYVVDLSQPRDPYIMGELELPGFSDYLHPLPNDLVLGFGKNAVPAEGPGDGDFAWYQGLQLSLFDVSDPARPDLVQRIDLGRRGSESSLRFDHHAFAYLPPDAAAGRPGRVSIPVVIHDAKTPSEISPLPWHFYDWRFTGLAMFEVFGPAGEAPALEFRDVLISHRAETDPFHNSYADASPLAGRSLISEHNAYFYLNGELYASPWGEASTVLGPY